METNKELMRAEFEAKFGGRFDMRRDFDKQSRYFANATNWIWEAWQAALSQRSEAVPSLDEALNDSDQVPYLIHFDDPYRQPELVIGGTRARYRFEQISSSWNAHLYVKIKSNSRDDKYPSANLAAPSAAAGEQVQAPVIEKPVDGLLDALKEISEACSCCGDRADLAEIAKDALDTYAAQPTPAQGDAVPVADAKLAVGVRANSNGITIAVHLKQGDVTTVLYTQDHPLDTDSMGAIDVPAALFATRQSSADAVDAARYRELRKDSQMYYVAYRNEGMGWAFSQINMDKLDKYIDAAIAAQGGKGEKE